MGAADDLYNICTGMISSVSERLKCSEDIVQSISERLLFIEDVMKKNKSMYGELYAEKFELLHEQLKELFGLFIEHLHKEADLTIRRKESLLDLADIYLAIYDPEEKD